jgi:hypothetical protein
MGLDRGRLERPAGDRRHPAARADRVGPVIGIILAAVSCFFWLFALPVMPFFAMTVILIDLFVIYGLAAHSTE